jgi:hypothetical protein
MHRHLTVKIASAVAGAGLIAATWAGVAAATAPTQPARLASTTTGHPTATKARSLLARAVWAQVEVRTRHGFVTYDYQRGTIFAVGGGELTVRGVDGRTVTYRTTTATKVRRAGAASSLSALRPGDRVLVVATGSPEVARRIIDRGPARTSATSAASAT